MDYTFEEVNVKIVNKSSNPIPRYQTEHSSGVDLISDEDVFIMSQETQLISTGLFVQIPQGFEFQVRSRSGLAGKKGIFVLNSPGTIDADYRGEVKILLHNTSKEPFAVRCGDRVAQMVLCPVYKAKFIEVDDLDETERGDGGFGHTGV